jgi:ubiquitin-conjugating enzyme E2 variant
VNRPYDYAPGHRLLEITCIGGLFAQLIYIGLHLGHGIATPAQAWGVGGALVAGYFVADFISGFFHWAGDALGNETTPLLGPHFIRPFRFHHLDQKDITRHDFIETNGNNCIVSVLGLAHVVVWMPVQPSFFFYYAALMFSTALCTFGTNQFHKWAHSDAVGPIVARLQKMGVILSPDHHRIHHAAPHDTYYCITHGMLNPLLAKLRFFRLMEQLVALVAPTFLHLEERKKFAEGQAGVERT